MNRTCNGRKFETDRKWYWRCLGDGSFIEVDQHLEDGAICPACKRPICLTTVEIETRIKITKQICIMMGRDWLDFKELILPG